MRRKTKKQWEQNGDAIRKGLKEGGIKRRHRFDSITLDSFNHIKTDGRRYTGYWTSDEKKKYIYRYQWVWMQANGKIPRGHIIHHKDHDQVNDSLDNLELMTASDHAKHHVQELRKKRRTIKTCPTCSIKFIAKYRYRKGTRKRQVYCSRPCFYNSR